MADRYDVAILGGGLAGLTLGLQLKRVRPDTSIVVLEKREGPAPEAAFKVGESTVEVGAHYFAEIAGMRDHLEKDHLFKFGLRYYFPADGNTDIAKRFQLGPPAEPPIPAFQIDRGRFENELAARNERAGNDVLGGSRVQDVEIGGDSDHTVSYERGGEQGTLTARWVVDASGRASLLKRKFGLEKDVAHTINSSWFRLAGGIDIDEWSDEEAWTSAPAYGKRFRSTNHLMGEGYWVWLIPLSSGAISIGIVADPRFHPFEEINTLDGAFDWISRHEPQLYSKIQDRREQVEDFLKIEDFAYGCERVYSPDRWCLTGEAGAFLDPFYSPGSDFIGYSNTLVTDMVTRELDGEDVGERVEALNAFYLRHFGALHDIYNDLYAAFGNPAVMSGKILWDLFIYWGGPPVLMFFQDRFPDVDLHGEIADELERYYALIKRMAQLFRDAQSRGAVISVEGLSNPIPLNEYLTKEYEDEAALLERLRETTKFVEAAAITLFSGTIKLLGEELDDDTAVIAQSVALDKDRRDEEDRFAHAAMTVAEARERADLGVPLIARA